MLLTALLVSKTLGQGVQKSNRLPVRARETAVPASGGDSPAVREQSSAADKGDSCHIVKTSGSFKVTLKVK